jgi:hypothetical protein
VTLTVLVDDRHDTARFVQRGIRQTFFSAQSLQPLFYFEWLDAECSTLTPSWDQIVVQNVPVNIDRRASLRVYGVGFLAQLVLHVVVSQVGKRHAAMKARLIDLLVEMLTFDFGPCGRLAREVMHKPY